MTDNGLAALAAALPLWMTERGAPDLAETIAATILGPRGVFLPDGLDAEFDFLARINAEQALTIATLRAALDAGATLLGYMDYGRMRVGGDEANRAYLAAWRAARAALAAAKESGG